MENHDYSKPHNAVFSFPNAEAAFSFLAEIQEQGWTGLVITADTGEEVIEPDFAMLDGSEKAE